MAQATKCQSNRGTAMVEWRAFAVLAAALSTVQSGCLAIYSTRPVEVTVTNADTGKPVANIPVTVEYVGMLILNVPKKAEGVTDEHGRLLLPIADFDNGPIHLQAGGWGRSINPETVRYGSIVDTGDWSGGSVSTPKIIMQLVPQRRSLAQRMFGWFDLSK
jgi:hypothetical protein